jgi:hypothetical protein
MRVSMSPVQRRPRQGALVAPATRRIHSAADIVLDDDDFAEDMSLSESIDDLDDSDDLEDFDELDEIDEVEELVQFNKPRQSESLDTAEKRRILTTDEWGNVVDPSQL